jgi:hypothetical protein
MITSWNVYYSSKGQGIVTAFSPEPGDALDPLKGCIGGNVVAESKNKPITRGNIPK